MAWEHGSSQADSFVPIYRPKKAARLRVEAWKPDLEKKLGDVIFSI